MQKEIQKLYKKVQGKISKVKFDSEINKIIKESDELFDEKTAALLFLEKIGVNENISKIKEIDTKKEATIVGKITKIGDIRTFSKKNNSKGRVINLEISDDSDSTNLVLWDKDVSLIQNEEIKIGSIIRIINGYIKNGYNGIEINVGKYSQIRVENDKKIDISNNFSKISGKIIEIENTKPFFKDNGEYGFVTNIKIKTDKDIKNITLWDKKVKEIQNYKIGDYIRFENIDIKNKNGVKEIHINGNTKILKL